MLDSQYLSLMAGYGAAIALLWIVMLALRPTFLSRPTVSFERPWLEVGLVIVAAIAVIGVGQLFVRNMLLPETSELTKSLNQLIIFSPILILLAVRGGLFARAYLPLNAAPLSLVVGAILAAVALVAYATAAGNPAGVVKLAASIVVPTNIHHVVQVLLEDIAIAALLARVAAALGGRVAVVVVAVLFAASHIPALLANGAAPTQLISLGLDTLIGVMVLGAVIRTQNIWWFWVLHSAMDLTQFYFKDIF